MARFKLQNLKVQIFLAIRRYLCYDKMRCEKKEMVL